MPLLGDNTAVANTRAMTSFCTPFIKLGYYLIYKSVLNAFNTSSNKVKKG